MNRYLTGLLLVVLAFKLGLFLSYTNGLSGVDIGGYLMSAYGWIEEQPNADLSRPIFSPGLVLLPFIFVFGDFYGYAIWTVLSTLPAAAGVYLLLTHFNTNTKVAAAVAFLYAINPWDMMMIVWGTTTSQGVGLLLLGIYFLLKKREVIGGVLYGLIPYFSMPISFPAIILIVPILFYTRSIKFAAVAGLLSLGSLYWSFQNAPGSVYGSEDHSLLFFVLSPYLIMAFMLGFIAACKLLYEKYYILAAALLFLSVVVLLGSSDESIQNMAQRTAYVVLPLSAIVLFKQWIPKLELKTLPVAIAALLIIITAVPSWAMQNSTTSRYSDDAIAAIERADGKIATNEFIAALIYSYELDYMVPYLKLDRMTDDLEILEAGGIHKENHTIVKCLLETDCPSRVTHLKEYPYLLWDRRAYGEWFTGTENELIENYQPLAPYELIFSQGTVDLYKVGI